MVEQLPTKAELRARIRADRRARTDANRAESAGRLAANAAMLIPDHPTDIACYVSMPTEPGTGLLLTALRLAGHRVWVPRVEGDRLVWVRIDAHTSWAESALGISEPTGPAMALPPGTTSVIFVPALAVDRAGNRLGQGGGFYDRALLDLPTHDDGGPLRVAIVFAVEVLDTVPSEPHDLRVDAVVTD